MLRLKCSCEKSAADISTTQDGKVRVSVPCLFCKQNHNYTVSQSIFFSRDIFLLNCPYSNMDICFIGSKECIDKEAERTGAELENLLKSLEASELKDIQPIDVDEEEALSDPTVYDAIRFLIKELEYDGKISCPCDNGNYDLRFCKEGIEVYCTNCGASHVFDTHAESATSEYLNIDELKLN